MPAFRTYNHYDWRIKEDTAAIYTHNSVKQSVTVKEGKQRGQPV